MDYPEWLPNVSVLLMFVNIRTHKRQLKFKLKLYASFTIQYKGMCSCLFINTEVRNLSVSKFSSSFFKLFLFSSFKQRQACYSNLPLLKLNRIYVKFVCSLWKNDNSCVTVLFTSIQHQHYRHTIVHRYGPLRLVWTQDVLRSKPIWQLFTFFNCPWSEPVFQQVPISVYGRWISKPDITKTVCTMIHT